MCGTGKAIQEPKFQYIPAQCNPEPNMLKTLPIIPSSTSQKIHPLFLFYVHIITYYSHIIL